MVGISAHSSISGLWALTFFGGLKMKLVEFETDKGAKFYANPEKIIHVEEHKGTVTINLNDKKYEVKGTLKDTVDKINEGLKGT